jgi:hypothetical protein
MRALDEKYVNKEKREPSVACTRTHDWLKEYWAVSRMPLVGLLVNQNVKHDSNHHSRIRNNLEHGNSSSHREMLVCLHLMKRV